YSFDRVGCHCGLHYFPTRRSSDLGFWIRQFVAIDRDALVRIESELFSFEQLIDIADPLLKAFEEAAEDFTGWAGIGYVDELLKTDRKSTRLNSSHVAISYAVFCLK